MKKLKSERREVKQKRAEKRVSGKSVFLLQKIIREQPPRKRRNH